jgi:hypothetical protein
MKYQLRLMKTYSILLYLHRHAQIKLRKYQKTCKKERTTITMLDYAQPSTILYIILSFNLILVRLYYITSLIES